MREYFLFTPKAIWEKFEVGRMKEENLMGDNISNGTNDKQVAIFSRKQALLYEKLTSLNHSIGFMYLGAISVLQHQENKDRFPQSAHSLRELMEKLPEKGGYVPSMPAELQSGNVLGKIRDAWNKLQYNNDLDKKDSKDLQRFFDSCKEALNPLECHMKRNEKFGKFFISETGFPSLEQFQKEIIDKWKGFCKYFQGISHHGKEAEETEFLNKQNEFDNFLYEIYFPRTFEDFSQLERLVGIGEGNAPEKVIDEITQIISRSYVCYRHFFSIIRSPEWICPLLEKGFFKQNTVVAEKGGEGFFSCPDFEYLSRVSPEASEKILQIFKSKNYDNRNPFIQKDFLKALSEMPKEVLNQNFKEIQQIICQWILASPVSFVYEQYAVFIKHLVEVEMYGYACHIVENLCLLAQNGEIKSIFREGYYYSECLKKIVPVLAQNCGLLALKTLSKLLEDVAQTLSRDSDSGYEGLHQWPRAIEDHPQNKYEKEPKDVLLFSLRDMADLIVSQNPEGNSTSINGILEAFGGFDHPLFKRLSAYVLWKHLSEKNKDDLKEQICRLCKNEEGKSSCFLSSLSFHHERYHLLEDSFFLLPESVREDYMDVVQNGFNEERYISIRISNGENPSAEEIERQRARYIFDMLYPIRKYLIEKWEDKFNRIKIDNSFGVSDHPDFLMYMGEARWLKPESPIETDDLAKKSLPDLVSYICHYQPPEDPFDTSVEGLSKALKEDFTSNPERYLSELDELKKLPPEYIRQILEAMRETINSRDFIFNNEYLESCFELIEWILDQEPGKKYAIKGPSWMAATYQDLHMGIAWLVETLVNTDKGRHLCPIQHRDRIWKIIYKLSKEEDPSPMEREEESLEIDSYSQAINSVRGLSIENAVRLALWVKNHFGDSFHGVKSVPEVFEALEKHLNVNPSTIARSICGHWFPWILSLSQEWAKDHSTIIFMTSDIKMFLPAWNAYIVYTPLYSNVFEVLKELVYSKAISFLDRDCSKETNDAFGDPGMKLAEHLAIAYWWGKIDTDEPKNILPEFFQRAPLRIREHFIKHIGWNLKDAGKNNAEPERIPTDRLRKLLETRLEQLLDKKGSIEELEHFGDWFASGYFDDDWGIKKLLQILSTGNQVEDSEDVMEHLAHLAASGTLFEDVLNTSRKMVEALGEKKWEMHGWNEYLREILKKGLESSVFHDMSVDFIHYLGSKGFVSFRDLL